jgi:hypothetical protein
VRNVPARAVLDAVSVLVVLVQSVARGRVVAGRMHTVDGTGLGGESPQRTARRALQDYVTCLTPMTVSFGYDAREKTLLIHELRRPGGGYPGPAARL